MNSNWKKSFFEYMEKNAFMGMVMGALNAMSTLGDIKENKAKMKLANPKLQSMNNSGNPYDSQFESQSVKTPNRSLYG